MPQIIAITNDQHEIIEPVWLARAENVHRELRPQLDANYAAQMAAIFADGAGMIVAVEEETVVGVAVFRQYRNTSCGNQFYIDDLVTTSQRRSQGVGKLLLDWLKQKAGDGGAKVFKLDSGTQRQQAHKFYFREGLVISCFNFTQSL
ncbi:GNAT family N-acetyltransferase [Chitinimonas sp. PSY-7]|uniref:GNAT family N-acetyltransferase n=1 Tax=Chitinimonas sp. PSY-7 TaxID=3459088 RepID=UPI00403FF209